MNFRIGKVNIKASFLFFAAAAYFLSDEMCKNYLCAIVFSSLHETGHIAALVHFHSPPTALTLGAVGIRIDKKALSMSYREECVAALCGPAVNLLFAVIFFILKEKYSIFEIPFAVNLGLFVINMLPVKILDGGRFLYFFASSRTSPDFADKIMRAAEAVTAVILTAVLAASLALGIVNTSFVLFSCGLAAMTVVSLLSDLKRP